MCSYDVLSIQPLSNHSTTSGQREFFYLFFFLGTTEFNIGKRLKGGVGRGYGKGKVGDVVGKELGRETGRGRVGYGRR